MLKNTIVTSVERILLQLNTIRAILESILLAKRRSGQFATLANRHKADVESRSHRF